MNDILKDMEYMICTKCSQEKPLDEFTKDKRCKNGRSHVCKVCTSKAMRVWQKEHPDRISRGDLDKVWYRHGISAETLSELFAKYDGKCWICLDSKAEVVDHDHNCCSGNRTCGKCIRGVLCKSCNTGVGMFYDSPDKLMRAVSYLTKEGNA